MKHYTIKFNNKNNNNSFNFRNLASNPSKDLDNLILSNLIKMNPYLADTTKKNDSGLLDAMFAEAGLDSGSDRIIIKNRFTSNLLEDDFDSKFAKAARFLANYTPTKKIYLTDGTPITFFEDEIQIGYTLIPLYKLTSPEYYTLLAPETKKTIINIFISIKG